MNFRITYLHNILYIKKERKGKKKKKRRENKNCDNMIKKKKMLIHTGRYQITPKK